MSTLDTETNRKAVMAAIDWDVIEVFAEDGEGYAGYEHLVSTMLAAIPQQSPVPQTGEPKL
jgi:hypothetical protein